MSDPVGVLRESLEMLRGMLRFPEDQEAGDAEIADALAALAVVEQLVVAARRARLVAFPLEPSGLKLVAANDLDAALLPFDGSDKESV